MSRTGNVISFSLAALLAGTFLFFNRSGRKTYQAVVALDGKGPFGGIYPGGADIVVLYRHGRDGVTCFDGFHSKELHDRLASKDGQVVTVQYDTFMTFGRIKAYNVHSIDGFILANGTSVLRPDFAASSGVAAAPNGHGGFEANGGDCW